MFAIFRFLDILPKDFKPGVVVKRSNLYLKEVKTNPTFDIRSTGDETRLLDRPPIPMLYVENCLLSQVEAAANEYAILFKNSNTGFVLYPSHADENYKIDYLTLFFVALKLINQSQDVKFYLSEKNDLREWLKDSMLESNLLDASFDEALASWKNQNKQFSLSGPAHMTLSQSGLMKGLEQYSSDLSIEITRTELTDMIAKFPKSNISKTA